jgi:hypothetical protein
MVTEYTLKRNSPIGQVPDGDADPGKESVLQSKIEAWCKEWGRPFLSFHQTKHARHVLPAGWPDLEIIMPGGQTLRLELKSSSGRLSKAQVATRLQFMALGHTIHQIRSFRAFKAIVGQIFK